jgi:excisionase family DNA binding protein
MPAALLTYADVAERFATTERHVRQLQERKQLPSVRVGRLVRFRAEDVDAYVESQAGR